jgi:hypothetical protein
MNISNNSCKLYWLIINYIAQHISIRSSIIPVFAYRASIPGIARKFFSRGNFVNNYRILFKPIFGTYRKTTADCKKDARDGLSCNFYWG